MNQGHQSLSLRLLFLLTATIAIFLLISTRVAASTPEPPPDTHRVIAGDTLWGIAVDLETGRDPRAVVDQIQELNSLSNADLQIGQILLLPSS